LRSEDVELQREAAFTAGEEKVVEAVPSLAVLVQSQNLGVQEAADRALRMIGGPAVVQAVVPLLRTDDPPARNIAMDVLREVGAEDFPSLVELLHDPDHDIRIFATDIIGSVKSPLGVMHLCGALLKDPEVNVRYQAAVSLGVLGRPEAAQCLAKAMTDEEWVQFAVIESLAKIRDESSVNALVGALPKATDLVASMIVDALGEIGNIKAVTMLIKRLDESPSALRNKICKAVVKILGAKSLALLSEADRRKLGDYLLAALGDEDTEIQDAAVLGLAFVGSEKATKAILDLAGSLDPDRDQERLEQIITSLASIGMNQPLEAAILNGNQTRIMVAVEALSRIGGKAVSEIFMRSFWQCDREGQCDRDVQREITQALIKVAQDEAVPFFLDVLERHGDGTVLKGALLFLGSKMHVEKAADKIFAMLDHSYDDVKEAALEACVALGGQSMAARFRDMAKSPDPLSRLMAVYALGKIEPEDNIKEIKEALEDEVPDIRKIALEAVAGLLGQNGEAMGLLVSKLSDESREVRLAVVEQIGRSAMPEGVEYLMQALDDPDDWVRIRAMEALGQRQAQEAIPKLMDLLVTSNKLLALKVVETLGAIGGNTAFRALLDLLGGEDHDLTAAAEEAIAKIQGEQGVDR
jgi:HEAT repeat protein